MVPLDKGHHFRRRKSLKNGAVLQRGTISVPLGHYFCMEKTGRICTLLQRGIKIVPQRALFYGPSNSAIFSVHQQSTFLPSHSYISLWVCIKPVVVHQQIKMQSAGLHFGWPPYLGWNFLQGLFQDATMPIAILILFTDGFLTIIVQAKTMLQPLLVLDTLPLLLCQRHILNRIEQNYLGFFQYLGLTSEEILTAQKNHNQYSYGAMVELWNK